MDNKPSDYRKVSQKKKSVQPSAEKPKQISSIQTLRGDNIFIILTVSGAALGILVGLYLSSLTNIHLQTRFYLEFPGKIFVNILHTMIVPLLTASVISGLASREMANLGRVVAVAIFYNLLTSAIALAVVIVVMMQLMPNLKTDKELVYKGDSDVKIDPFFALMDLLSQSLPENFIKAFSYLVVTEFKVVEPESSLPVGPNNRTTEQSFKPVLVNRHGMNIIGVVLVSTAFGYSLNLLKEEGTPLKNFFQSVNTTMTTMMNIFLWYTPIGLAFLIAANIFESREISTKLDFIGKYFALLIGSMFIHCIIVLPLIYFVVTKRNPFFYSLRVARALFTALATNCSYTTVPILLQCLVNNCKLNASLAHFLVPFSTTFNFSGTMLYEVLTILFVIKQKGFLLSTFDIFIISMTSSCTGIVTSGIPHSGLITVVAVLLSLGIPTDDVGIILSMDWVIDRLKTVCNVWGDCMEAAVMNHNFQSSIEMNHKLRIIKAAKRNSKSITSSESSSSEKVSKLGSGKSSQLTQASTKSEESIPSSNTNLH